MSDISRLGSSAVGEIFFDGEDFWECTSYAELPTVTLTRAGDGKRANFVFTSPMSEKFEFVSLPDEVRDALRKMFGGAWK